MDAGELEQAKQALDRLPAVVSDLSGGALGVELTLVYPDRPLTNLQLSGYGDGEVWPARESVADEVNTHPGFDSVIVLWKKGPIMAGSGLALNSGRYEAGHATFPVDAMRPFLPSYEGPVHEFGHTVEGFYCPSTNFFDHCGDFGLSRCALDSVYPPLSNCCCYRALYSGRVSALDGSGCHLGAETYAAMGTPMSPK